MSLTKNKCVRCDWCGKLTRDRDAHYLKPDGVNYGRIVQPEWVRFPGGDPTAEMVPHPDEEKDICEECAADLCPACGSPKIVRTTPTVAGPTGWGGRCKACQFVWGLPAVELPPVPVEPLPEIPSLFAPPPAGLPEIPEALPEPIPEFKPENQR